MKKKTLLISVFFIVISFFCISNSINLYASGSAGSGAIYESRYIIDMPNAGMLYKASYSTSTKFIDGGGLLVDFTTAPFDFLNIGVSYSVSGLIGAGGIKVHQKYPGFNVKARILDERLTIPAIAVGFYSQGNGLYYDDTASERFSQLSPGFYVAASKSFIWDLGEVSVHAGVNYCIDTKEDAGINIYAGIEHTLGKYFSLLCEFNPNFNDDNKVIPNSKFKFNTAVRASVSDNITFELQFRDIFTSSKNNGFNRFVGIEFINRF